MAEGQNGVSNNTTTASSNGITAPKSGTTYSTSLFREEWINKQMQSRMGEFTCERTFHIHIGTWNVNAKKPSEDLQSWLTPSPSVSGIDAHIQPDIYCIGFQEIVDLNAGNLLVDHTASRPWEERIERTLRQQYTQILSKHLVGLSLVIYIKRSLFPYVGDIQSETVGVGIMGVGGNKGAVAIRFKFYDSSLCFVNSHLAAHQHNCQGRNQDFHNILSRLRFTDKKSAAQDKKNASTYGIRDHTHCFWLGDLNYRLDCEINQVYERIDVQDWDFLLTKDQLIREKSLGNAFTEWREGKIDFPPTYKYQPGTLIYDRRPDKKVRCPAWCDRIQWTGSGGINQLCYKRSEQTVSDHKPVYSIFNVQVKEVLPDKKKEVALQLSKQLDLWENECIPKLQLSTAVLSFEEVAFDVPKSVSLKIENTGSVLAHFLFVPKVNESEISKPWLRVEPDHGIIPPNSSTEITLTIHVTRTSSHNLNTSVENLDDIIILRVEHGRDHYIQYTGDYLRSCCGATIDFLVNNPLAIRNPSNTRSRPTLSPPSNPQREGGPSKVLSIPKELWRMVDFIYQYGMETENLFSDAGIVGERDLIISCLDTGSDFLTSMSVHSMCEALIYFLKSLAEPVFPDKLAQEWQNDNSSMHNNIHPSNVKHGHHNNHNAHDLTTFCKESLRYLPPAHYNVFVYIISFIREVLKHSESNKTTPMAMVITFAQGLFHTNIDDSEESNKPNKAWFILKHFISSDDFA